MKTEKYIKSILCNNYENSSESEMIEQIISTVKGSENFDIIGMVKEWYSTGIKEYWKFYNLELAGTIQAEIFLSLLVYKYTKEKEKVSGLTNLSFYINGRWLDFGFYRLDFSGSIQQKVACAIVQYFYLGYTEVPEKIFVDNKILVY